MTHPSNPKCGQVGQNCEKQQLNGAMAVAGLKLECEGEISPTDEVEDTPDPSANPVIPNRQCQNALPSVGLQSGFEESPEWRQYYDPSSRLSQLEGTYLLDSQNRLQPTRSFFSTKNFSTQTLTTTRTLSERSSTTTAELSSKRLLHLSQPPSRRNFLKAGNLRLKQLIKSKGTAYFRTQSVVENEQDCMGQLQKLHLTALQTDLQRKGSKCRMDRIEKDEVERSQKTIRNAESISSIVDLNQVEKRHRLEKSNHRTLSESWDEIFKVMRGFNADSVDHGSNSHYNCAQSSEVIISTDKHDIQPSTDAASKYDTIASQNVPAKIPTLPGPRTSSMAAAMVNGSPIFQVVTAECSAQSTPSGQSRPQFPKQGNPPAETDMNLMSGKQFPIPRPPKARSPEGLLRFGPIPNGSQSTIALETIEAEMNNNQPLSPWIMKQPLFVNCTPQQPITAPTDPPVGPLPKLPEEFNKADAASRVSYHNFTSTLVSRPFIPPRSPHRRNLSTNSASSRLIIREASPQKLHRKKSSLSTRNQRRPNSIRDYQSLPARRSSSRISIQPKLALTVHNNATGTSFNSGNSQDCLSPCASEPGQENEMVEPIGSATAKSSLPTNDVVSLRSEHIKRLKLRDLAKEKATRSCNRRQHSHLDDAVIEAKTSFTAINGSSQAHQLSDLLHASGKPSSASQENNTGISRPASRQDSAKRRPNYQARRALSNRTIQIAARPTMSQSQIMVLAETDPDTQTFRASTPTTSLRRTDSRKTETPFPARERRITNRKSKNNIQSRLFPHATTTARGIPALQPNREHTPPHSEPSIHSSDDDDDDETIHRFPTPGHSGCTNTHIRALVTEDSNPESDPSKHGFAALARKEETRYLKEQLLLQRLKRESSELKLAMRLLSGGLEKLTMFVNGVEDVEKEGRREGLKGRGYGLIEKEMEPVRALVERGFHGGSLPGAISTVSPGRDDGVRSFEQVREDSVGVERRGSNVHANDARPISLVSRYSSVRKRDRNSMGESVLTNPVVKDEMIRIQMED